MANKTGIKYGGRQKGTANKATARLRVTNYKKLIYLWYEENYHTYINHCCFFLLL